MESDVQHTFLEEDERLKLTTKEMNEQLAKLLAVPRYAGDNPTEQVLESIREDKRRNLKQAITEPYFGRLDFQESGQAESLPLYIGKLGIEKSDSPELLVIDWRAPIASLFYSFTGGEDMAAYTAPEGDIEGTVHLKRNLVVRGSQLQRVVDTYSKAAGSSGVSDEFLLYRLGENKDNRLRDIVSTIQAEQDDIIRANREQALIIQGVAGSGKTTVALHRLAYLLYRYRDIVKAEKMIIFAPNRMFLDYISSVLPELGVGHIQQTTFPEWALELLEHEVSLTDDAERLRYWFDGSGRTMDDSMLNTASGRAKGALRYMEWLDSALTSFEHVCVPGDDYIPFEGAILPSGKVREWHEIEYKHEPLMKRRERVLARIKRWQEMQLENIYDPRIRKERRKQAGQRLRDYSKRWTAFTPFTWYRELFQENEPPFMHGSCEEMPLSEQVRRETAQLCRKKKVQPEDLAPLVYIRNRFWGIRGEHRFDHTVIDEAQDYSPFQVALLYSHTKNGSFTILGDTAQGIHGYQGIHHWDEFLQLFPEERRGYFSLTRSYRSTMEIILFANKVLERGIPNPPEPAVPVFRSGDEVEIMSVGEGDLAQLLDEEIAAHLSQAGEAGTFAVLTRTEARSRELHAVLSNAGCNVNLIVPGQQQYQGGVSILPVYLAKGLEFDKVLLVDVDAKHYPLNSSSAKLLYVGCTRALHVLKLYYDQMPSPLLQDHNETN